MSDVLVIFGSGSDRAIFEPLMSALRKADVSAALRICSAHKTPVELDEIVKGSDAKIIVAGAGLSAALPGVCASLVPVKPVIGLPVNGAYQGLDALLAVHQMPTGVPVLGAGVDAWQSVADEVPKMFEKIKGVVLVNRGEGNDIYNSVISRAERILSEFKVDYETTSVPRFTGKHRVFIDFLSTSEMGLVQKTESPVINVPVLRDGGTANDALKMAGGTAKGLFVGVNAGENAALAAIQVMNVANGEYSDRLMRHRGAIAEKVLDADRKESGKYA
ncbi:AIR carboxylase family protein [Candidatus Micrarchaeota archaeon]|nr:AIR carboxylase family protein [Candidatus Micrarchaeota archaeon]